MRLVDVGALDLHGFVGAFGAVYEDAPGLAADAYARRPFATFDHLVDAFHSALDDLSEDDVLVLLRAHPELGTGGPMAAASVAEQSGAGLDGAHPRRQEIAAVNIAYRQRFGFPFIIAVRGRSIDEIADALAWRVTNGPGQELRTAVAQVKQIARLRLEALVVG